MNNLDEQYENLWHIKNLGNLTSEKMFSIAKIEEISVFGKEFFNHT